MRGQKREEAPIKIDKKPAISYQQSAISPGKGRKGNRKAQSARESPVINRRFSPTREQQSAERIEQSVKSYRPRMDADEHRKKRFSD